MGQYTVEFSSSPASEHLPSNSPQRRRPNNFTVPDDVASTTPAAPPPSQLFGSSQFGTGVSKLQFTHGSNTTSSAPRPQPQQLGGNRPSSLPKSRLFEQSTNSYASDQNDGDDTNEMMDEDEDDFAYSRGFPQVRPTAPSLMKFSTNTMQQSVGPSTNRRLSVHSRLQLPRKGNYDVIPGLARDFAKRSGAATLTEPDEIILGAEDLLRSLDDECQKSSNEASLQSVATAAAHELTSQWRRRSKQKSFSTGLNGIGPDTKAPQFEKAQYLANLLLHLRHPPVAAADGESLMVVEDSRGLGQKPIPELLLEWLDTYHVNYGPLFEQVVTTAPAPSANELYWDAIETFTLRGKFPEVMELLKRGDLNYAKIDTPSGTKDANFTGTQLQQAEDAIYRARQLINSCPALQSGDWHLGGQDWDVYRKQLESEIDHLAEQVHSTDETSMRYPKDVGGLFGKVPTNSGLPFIIYQRLKTVYNIMLGDVEEIMGLAQDWVESCILLTVWWVPNGARNITQWSFDVSRAGGNPVEESDPYLKRLSDAFLCVTDPESDKGFQLNAMDPVEVGLGAVLQGDIQSCLRVFQSLSLCVASAVVEIGSWAGWLAAVSSSAGLDQDDLMVLNYGSNDAPMTKDDILEHYARVLFERDSIHSPEGNVEGWELSFSILSRLDDQARMHTKISELLADLAVTDQERTAKLVDICEQLGLEDEGRKVSENFADSLVNNTTEYGTALLCYARAHAEHKVRQVIDLLNSYCLVQSSAYPTEDAMDPALAQLVGSPKLALQNIADADPQAAEILQFHLVGYACLRKFYSLRDDTTNKTRFHSRPLAKKKAASKALIAAISSAADCIYGGLYDPDRQAAVQVDGLLTMLGEATVFLAQDSERRVLSTDQLYAMLAAIEDLQTVSPRVYRATEECMEASLRNYHGSLPPSPHAMLKKSVSSGTNSNFSFSMMGSEMLARSEESLGANSLGSTVLVGKRDGVKVERGWDWRAQFKDEGVAGADVLRHLRLSIAKELSTATLEEGSGNL